MSEFGSFFQTWKSLGILPAPEAYPCLYCLLAQEARRTLGSKGWVATSLLVLGVNALWGQSGGQGQRGSDCRGWTWL